jgi:hypothetical protein
MMMANGEEPGKRPRIFNFVGGYFCGYRIAMENVPDNGQIMIMAFDDLELRPPIVHHMYRIEGDDLIFCGESLTPFKIVHE